MAVKRKRVPWMSVIALLLVSGCAPTVLQTRVGLPVNPPASFITTFWCGPPLADFDDARAAEIAAAGFTVVGPPCEGAIDSGGNRRALDIAARHGLKMWVADARFNERAAEQPDWEAGIAAAVAEYGRHAGFGGYFVTDEPAPGSFDALRAIAGSLRAADRESLVYINLLPDYAVTGQIGMAYREYVESFITTVRPSLLSYDYYPFGLEGDRSTFFESLTLIRSLAVQNRLPFMLIVLAMPHGPYRDPTEAELSWQVFHALAFGAHGISYFAYWTPVNVEFADVLKFRFGLIEQGKPTVHYFQATRMNRAVRAIAGQLALFHSVAVADSMGQVAAPLPIGPITAIEGGIVTAGAFADDTGQFAVLLVNRDYRSGATITLRFQPGAQLPRRFDVESRTWSESGGATMRLPAGGAQLLRWPRS